jgi:ribonucleotide reductase alpha subunit
MGHVKMMAAVQPFLSGAISKTINMPEECTVEDIMTACTERWKLGLKAVAIYRDNSKRVQPPSSGSGKGPRNHNFSATGVAQTLSLLRPDSSRTRFGARPAGVRDESGRSRNECRRHIAHATNVTLFLRGP